MTARQPPSIGALSVYPETMPGFPGSTRQLLVLCRVFSPFLFYLAASDKLKSKAGSNVKNNQTTATERCYQKKKGGKLELSIIPQCFIRQAL